MASSSGAATGSHLLRAEELQQLDHAAILMEPHARYVECWVAGERAGHYYTCINSYLMGEEAAYIIANSESPSLR